MESIQPDHADPLPRSPGMAVIVMRFVGLLTVAIVVLALIWS